MFKAILRFTRVKNFQNKNDFKNLTKRKKNVSIL